LMPIQPKAPIPVNKALVAGAAFGLRRLLQL
jgi:hypothetical protein